MSGLRLPAATYEALARTLLADGSTERCAIGYAHHDPSTGRWTLESADPMPEDGYEHRDRVSATLRPQVLVEAANRARAGRLSPVLIHTHPDAAGRPVFSAIDDRGEAEIKEYFERRAPDAAPLAMVIGPDGARVRRLGTDEPVDLWTIGATLERLSGSDEAANDERHDRQVRAFGAAGQARLARLRILVVGAGGTGSVTLQQLAHLGAMNIIVIDPDCVEATNLNRLVGATPADIGRPKVDVARRMIQAINPHARVEAIVGDIVDAEQAARIAGCDFIFLCTDSHASRALVCQAAYQYLVPVIDMGVSITSPDGAVTHITGRVQMLAPGLACLTCTGALDGEQIRREMLTPEQRAADPYIIGEHVPQPAVISINTTMASLAMTMFLGAVTGMPAHARYQRYDGLQGVVRLMGADPRLGCITCSADGALAKAGSWPLPTRARAPQAGDMP